MATKTIDPVRKVNELMKDIQIAMLTTITPDGDLHSRPMGLQQAEFDGSLWFFTQRSSRKSQELRRDERVNVAFSKPDDQRYVSLAGTATLVDDKAKMKELWSPLLKAWFPQGLEDPELTLIRVDVESAEYWDSPSGAVVALAGFVKAVVTGRPIQGGENESLRM